MSNYETYAQLAVMGQELGEQTNTHVAQPVWNALGAMVFGGETDPQRALYGYLSPSLELPPLKRWLAASSDATLQRIDDRVRLQQAFAVGNDTYTQLQQWQDVDGFTYLNEGGSVAAYRYRTGPDTAGDQVLRVWHADKDKIAVMRDIDGRAEATLLLSSLPSWRNFELISGMSYSGGISAHYAGENLQRLRGESLETLESDEVLSRALAAVGTLDNVRITLEGNPENFCLNDEPNDPHIVGIDLWNNRPDPGQNYAALTYAIFAAGLRPESGTYYNYTPQGERLQQRYLKLVADQYKDHPTILEAVKGAVRETQKRRPRR